MLTAGCFVPAFIVPTPLHALHPQLREVAAAPPGVHLPSLPEDGRWERPMLRLAGQPATFSSFQLPVLKGSLAQSGGDMAPEQKAEDSPTSPRVEPANSNASQRH